MTVEQFGEVVSEAVAKLPIRAVIFSRSMLTSCLFLSRQEAMAKELVDEELWTLIGPLWPARAPRNRLYAGRELTPDRAVFTGIVCAALRHRLEPAAAGDRVRLRYRLLATAGRMAGDGSLATHPRDAAVATQPLAKNRCLFGVALSGSVDHVNHRCGGPVGACVRNAERSPAQSA